MFSRGKKMFIGFLALVMLVVSAYFTFILSDVPFIAKWRNIWIETAMTTGEHQWLATKFIPSVIIDETMKNIVTTTEAVDEIVDMQVVETIEEKYKHLHKGDKDFAGNVVYDVNIPNGLAIVEIKGETYAGKAAIVFDPKIVRVAHTDKKGVRGENIQTFMKEEDAILAMNGSGFGDPNGQGSGGTIMGASMASGRMWGTYTSSMDTIALDIHNRLLVGNRDDWDKYMIRDAVQFNPVLIQNGKQNISGTAGWGLQPRTAIGQRKDGALIMIVIDGRQPGHSIGATMEDLVKEFSKYDVVNAAACDGGSSSIMGYKGDIITRCSSPQNGGRYLPNVFLVERTEKVVVDISGGVHNEDSSKAS